MVSMTKRLLPILCIMLGVILSTRADVRDSIHYFIVHQNKYSDEELSLRMEALANSLFNTYSPDEIGAFCETLAPKIPSVKSLFAKMHLMEIQCAYLNNSAQFDKAEQCGLDVVAMGEKHNLPKMIASGLEDLHFIYNHQARYQDQIDVLDRAIKIRQTHRIEPTEDLAYDMMWKAEAYSYMGAFDSAYVSIDRAASIIPAENPEMLANIYERYSRIALEQGNYSESMRYSQMSLDIARPLNMQTRIETNLMYQGYSSFYLGQYEEAIRYEKEALDMYQGSRDANTASVYHRLGKIYNATGDYLTAIDFLQQAMDIYKEVDYDIGKARVNVELSQSYLGQQKLDLARQTINQSIEVFTSVGDQVKLARAQRVYALIELQAGYCDLALNYQKDAIDILQESKKIAALGQAKVEMSRILLQCQQSSTAYEKAQQALQLSTQSKDVLTMMNANLALSQIAENESQHAAALRFQSEYHRLYQKISTASNQRAMAQEKARFDVQRAEEQQQMAELKNESLQQKNRFLQTGGLAALFLTGLLTYFLYQRHRYNQTLQTKNQYITAQKDELQALNATKDKFFSIIAHDLRSPLVAFQGIGKQIKYYSQRDDAAKLEELCHHIEDLSMRLNTLLDNLLNWSLVSTGQIPHRPRKLDIEAEIEEVIDIFHPLAKAKSINLSYQIQKSEMVIYADVRAVQTILRNIYSNAIKFTPEGGSVKTAIQEENDEILIKVQDTGIGMNQSQLDNLFIINKQTTTGTNGEKGTGLGTLLSQELIHMNQGKLLINSTLGQGTIVHIFLPKAG